MGGGFNIPLELEYMIIWPFFVLLVLLSLLTNDPLLLPPLEVVRFIEGALESSAPIKHSSLLLFFMLGDELPEPAPK